MWKQTSILSLILLLQYVNLGQSASAWEPEQESMNMARHQTIVNQTKTQGSKIQLIFYGDSITQGWEWYGQSTWTANYGSMNAVNYGIAGDRTQHVIWRIENGEVAGLKPKVVVLMIGTNNLGSSPDADIPKGVKKVIDDLQTRTGTKVLVLGLLPRQYNNNEHNGKQVSAINAMIAKFDNGGTIRYLDMWSHFVGSTIDTVNTSLYQTDKLHLNAEGYKVWAQTMSPLLKQMFG